MLPDFFAPVKSLKILDFSRTKQLNLNKFQETLFELGNNSIQKLLLRHVQAIALRLENNWVEALNLTKLLCPLGGTLGVIDLSFNDFLMVQVVPDSIGCM